ncbi:hypothetical protein DFH09DRAFT_1073121 [Mycena vulgaris]|nr:hypothetical protein DFH09DRAFT_1073121 [Mycena vulgaris]
MAAQRTTKLEFELSLLLCNSLGVAAVYAIGISRRTLCVLLISASEDIHVPFNMGKVYRTTCSLLHTTTNDMDRPNQDSIFSGPSWMSTPIPIPRPTWPPRRSIYGTTHGKVDTMGSSEGILKVQGTRHGHCPSPQAGHAHQAAGAGRPQVGAARQRVCESVPGAQGLRGALAGGVLLHAVNVLARDELSEEAEGAEFEEAEGTPGSGARRESEHGRLGAGYQPHTDTCCVAQPYCAEMGADLGYIETRRTFFNGVSRRRWGPHLAISATKLGPQIVFFELDR